MSKTEGKLPAGRTLATLGVGIIVGAFVAGAAAFAAVPGPDKVIHGCRQKITGVVRVIDPTATGPLQKRLPGEEPLDWNQQGATGVKGDNGATGVRRAPQALPV